jgi:hypothetical protein
MQLDLKSSVVCDTRTSFTFVSFILGLGIASIKDRLNRNYIVALFGLLFLIFKASIEVYWLEPKRIVFRECIIKIFSAKLSDGTNV